MISLPEKQKVQFFCLTLTILFSSELRWGLGEIPSPPGPQFLTCKMRLLHTQYTFHKAGGSGHRCVGGCVPAQLAFCCYWHSQAFPSHITGPPKISRLAWKYCPLAKAARTNQCLDHFGLASRDPVGTGVGSQGASLSSCAGPALTLFFHVPLPPFPLNPPTLFPSLFLPLSTSLYLCLFPSLLPSFLHPLPLSLLPLIPSTHPVPPLV